MAESSPSGAKHLLLALLVAIGVFAGMAPTLAWPQFTGGNENIVVQSALEMRRGGPWLVPSMLGEPRVKKPPLVAWITALSMRQSTLDQLDHPDTRDQAYRDLAWQVRWTGLLAASVMVFATFFLGRALFDSRLGLYSAIVVGTTILFQKYMRQSTSDVHLAMWVTVANACFACAILRGRVWSGLLLGAIATGLAFLCKGPVALLETVLPAIAMVFLPLPPGEGRGEGAGHVESASAQVSPLSLNLSRRERGHLLPLIVSVLLFCLIAFPWFIHVFLTVPDVVATWTTEVSRHGASGLGPDPVYAYIMRIPLNWPWIVMLVVGVIVMWKARSRGDLYAAALVVLPILVMTFIPDRKERYLLPMLAPLAIVCARGLIAWIDSPRTDRAGGWITLLHVGSLALICIGFPILGSMHPELKRLDGTPWYSRDLAIWLAIGFASVIALGLVSNAHRRVSLTIATFVCLIGLQAMVMFAYADTFSGRSVFKPMAEAIRAIQPDGVFDFDEDIRVDEETAIYLNRTILYADPNTLTPSTRPLVYLIRQRRDEAEPAPATGWTFLTKVKDKKDTWWAFVRFAPSPGTPGDGRGEGK